MHVNRVRLQVGVIFALGMMLAGCQKEVYVDANGHVAPRPVTPEEAVFLDTGCKGYLYETDNGYTVIVQKFRADGKPDCPGVK